MSTSPPFVIHGRKNDCLMGPESNDCLDKSGSVLLAGARPRRALLGERNTTSRPLSVCPSVVVPSGRESTFNMVRRYSEINLAAATSDAALRYRTSPVQHAKPSAVEQTTPGAEKLTRTETRTRRYGMDFGPTRRVFEPPRIKTPALDDHWELRNAQPGQISPYAASISEDGVSTVYDSFDFPQPPPISSPLIRRMQSTSWLMDDNRNSCKLSEKQRIALGTELMYPRTPQTNLTSSSTRTNTDDNVWTRSQSSTSTISGHFPGAVRDMEYLQQHPYSDMVNERENLNRLGDALFGDNVEDWPDSVAASDSQFESRMQMHMATHVPPTFTRICPPNIILSQSTPVMPQHDRYNAPDHQTPSDRHNQRALGRLPRIIRKVASMRSDTQKAGGVSAGQPGGGGFAGHRSIPKARSFRSIFRPSEPEESQNKMPASATSSNRLSWFNSSSQSAVNLRSSSSTRLGQFHAAGQGNDHDSMDKRSVAHPLPRSDSKAPQTRRRSVNYAVLGDPFSEHPKHTHWAAGPETQRNLDSGSTSFMDISPVYRDARVEAARTGSKREKMKDFFSRTGTIFAWGNQKKNKNSTK